MEAMPSTARCRERTYSPRDRHRLQAPQQLASVGNLAGGGELHFRGAKVGLGIGDEADVARRGGLFQARLGCLQLLAGLQAPGELGEELVSLALEREISEVAAAREAGKELLVRLRTSFAYLVIDTPPVNAVTDAAILAADADATVLVVEDGKTTIPALRHAKASIERVGARLAGPIVNKMRPDRPRAHLLRLLARGQRSK